VTGTECPGWFFDDMLWQRTWPGRLGEIYSEPTLQAILEARVLPTWKDLQNRVNQELFRLLDNQNAWIITSGSEESTLQKLPSWLHHKVKETSAPKRAYSFWKGKSGLVIDDDPEVTSAARVAGLAALDWKPK